MANGLTVTAVASRALATPELLENIILFVPERDVISSVQRVCRHFKEVIEGSIVLKRKLFLLPEDEDNIVDIRPDEWAHFSPRPVEDLKALPNPFFFDASNITTDAYGTELYTAPVLKFLGCANEHAIARIFETMHCTKPPTAWLTLDLVIHQSLICINKMGQQAITMGDIVFLLNLIDKNVIQLQGDVTCSISAMSGEGLRGGPILHALAERDLRIVNDNPFIFDITSARECKSGRFLDL